MTSDCLKSNREILQASLVNAVKQLDRIFIGVTNGGISPTMIISVGNAESIVKYLSCCNLAALF